ncbi:MAG: nucleoside triphosphate pyrophosphohydrolase [Hyphomicrobiaceae bacterium]
MKPGRDISRLVEIMAALRTPVTGCPWDLEQSFATIAPYTVEEAYEVADAIERGDLVDLKEELGDLLLQVVYHARLADEQGAFDLGDVVLGITRKMIRRHPHVFGDARRATTGEARASWERIKAEEKAEKAAERARSGTGGIATDKPASPLLGDIPAALPALTTALRLQDKAAGVGFDWPSLAPVLDKVREELAELEEVALAADPRGSHPDGQSTPPPDKDRIEEELGDLLFVIANVARHLGVHPESALRRANAKFVRRFGAIEAKLATTGRTPAESDLAEMDALWNEAKRKEKRGDPA